LVPLRAIESSPEGPVGGMSTPIQLFGRLYGLVSLPVVFLNNMVAGFSAPGFPGAVPEVLTGCVTG
jgi:hypothetical protein